MKRFTDAMRFVEEEHAFPERPEDVHGARFSMLLEEADLVGPVERVPTIVVAGSSGKASTARMIASVARAVLDRAGDRRPVVLGTKPPLHETPDGNRERYQVLRHGFAERLDGPTPGAAWARACWIDPETFADQVEALRPLAERVEARGVALAPYDLRYAILARLAHTEGAALAVVEANIGLRSDVAGCWPGPRVDVLTHIGTDHAKLLRAPEAFTAAHPELGEAAGPLWHKAGGVAPGAVVVLGPQAPAIEALARELAFEAGAREVIHVSDRCTVSGAETSLEGSRAELTLDGRSMPIAVSALGDYQLENATIAALTCAVLTGEGLVDVLSADAIAEGLLRVVIPGRLEVVDRAPTTLLNVTEGASKVRSLLPALRGLGAKRFVVCASVLARVDGAREIVETLASAPETQALVTTQHNPDDLPAVELAAWARRHGELDVRSEPDARKAVALARSLATEEGMVLLVGSGLSNALEAG